MIELGFFDHEISFLYVVAAHCGLKIRLRTMTQEGEQIGTYHDDHRPLRRFLILSEAWQNPVLPHLFVNHREAFLVLIVDPGRNEQEAHS